MWPFNRYRIPPSRRIEAETFQCFNDRNSGRVFEDLEFRRCRFESCGISISRDPGRRATVRDIRIIDCEEDGSDLWGAIAEDVLVDGFRTTGLQAWAAVYKHVTLRGKIGRLMTSPYLAPTAFEPNPEDQRRFDEANAEFYATVDWALDISEAEFQDVDIRGIPARLIRRDPATQVVVTREKGIDVQRRYPQLEGTFWGRIIELAFRDIHEHPDDVVLVAPKRHRSYRTLLDGLKLLRDLGVAELD